MDIYIKSDISTIEKILAAKEFSITRKKNHFSAMHYIKGGRYHFLYAFIDGEVFCDFHFDNTLHAIGTGADYGKKPEAYFDSQIKKILRKEDISYKIKKVNWFTRRNKAIITGFRL
jgi:hypothetical protein